MKRRDRLREAVYPAIFTVSNVNDSVKLFMKCYEFFVITCFAVQPVRFFGCKAFNKNQSIRVIGTSEKVIGYTTLFSPGFFLDLRCCFQNLVPCFLAAV